MLVAGGGKRREFVDEDEGKRQAVQGRGVESNGVRRKYEFGGGPKRKKGSRRCKGRTKGPKRRKKRRRLAVQSLEEIELVLDKLRGGMLTRKVFRKSGEVRGIQLERSAQGVIIPARS